jgi:hypothetical protein
MVRNVPAKMEEWADKYGSETGHTKMDLAGKSL